MYPGWGRTLTIVNYTTVRTSGFEAMDAPIAQDQFHHLQGKVAHLRRAVGSARPAAWVDEFS